MRDIINSIMNEKKLCKAYWFLVFKTKNACHTAIEIIMIIYTFVGVHFWI